ncbi:MAG: hypothetical protein NVSMB13_11690 [Mycobacteriales bacterium]
MRTLTRRALAVCAVLVATACGSSSSAGKAASSTPPAATTSSSPSGGGLNTGPPPWSLPASGIAAITAAGLPGLDQEALDVHYHAHLDVVVDGAKVPVVANLGIDYKAQKISPLHTHDTTGVIHIEAAKSDVFTLGQLFTEWGVRLGPDCVGGLCTGGGKSLRVYVNGQLRAGDPTAVAFTSHEEVALVYRADSDSTPVPAKYDFGSGL